MDKEIFTLEEKKQIADNILALHKSSGLSGRKFAASIGFKEADISNLNTGAWQKNPKLIGDQKWLRLAQRAGFTRDVELKLEAAHTAVFDYITEQLRVCQSASTYSLMCDSAGIGKTYACQHYKRENPYVLYIDCSLCPKATQFKRTFSAAAGIAPIGSIDEVFEAAILSVKQMNKPLLILDEAGDLNDNVFKVVKRLYNDLEDVCGICLFGAGGLKHKIERGISCNKVGFEELFSRFGRDYGRFTPDPTKTSRAAFDDYMRKEMEAVLLANGFSKQMAAATCNKMKGRDLRAVKRAIKAIRMSEMQSECESL